MVLQPSALTILYYTYGAIAGTVFLASLIAVSAVFLDTRIVKYARRKARREARRSEPNRGNTNEGFLPLEPDAAMPSAPPPHPATIHSSLSVATPGSLPPPYEQHTSEYLTPMNETRGDLDTETTSNLILANPTPAGTLSYRSPTTPLPADPIYQAIERARKREEEGPGTHNYDSSIKLTSGIKTRKALTDEPTSPIQVEDDQHDLAETSFVQPSPVQTEFVAPSKVTSTDQDDVFMAKTTLMHKPSLSKRPIQESLEEEENIEGENYEFALEPVAEACTASASQRLDTTQPALPEEQGSMHISQPVMGTPTTSLSLESDVGVKQPENQEQDTDLPIVHHIANPIACPSEEEQKAEDESFEVEATDNESATTNGNKEEIVEGLNNEIKKIATPSHENTNNRDQAQISLKADKSSKERAWDDIDVPDEELLIPAEEDAHDSNIIKDSLDKTAGKKLKEEHYSDVLEESVVYAIVHKESKKKVRKPKENEIEDENEKNEGSDSLTDGSMSEMEPLNMDILDDFEDLLKQKIEDKKNNVVTPDESSAEKDPSSIE